MTQHEEWRSIAGFPRYQVSNLGRVRSFRRGDLFKVVILKPSKANKQKRALVTLFCDKKPAYRLISRLVCEAFNGPPPSPYHQAAHDDGDTQNDSASNLFWRTALENAADRDRHGRTKRGQDHYAAKLNAEKVLAIRSNYETAKSQGKVYGAVVMLAETNGVTLGCIEDIIYGRKWRHI